MTKDKWVWMPHPGHFICARDCRFHLNTYVGTYIVSTVGEYLPDSEVREILAQERGVILEGKGSDRLRDFMEKIGFEEIGYERKYETMVFTAKSSEHKCCPFAVDDYESKDFEGYNTPEDAYLGHLELCDKWANQ